MLHQRQSNITLAAQPKEGYFAQKVERINSRAVRKTVFLSGYKHTRKSLENKHFFSIETKIWIKSRIIWSEGNTVRTGIGWN